MNRIFGFARVGFNAFLQAWKKLDANQVAAMSCCVDRKREQQRLKMNPWRF